ncbi:hypothetical protein ACFL0H_13360 [Thermodesulfobacteriota bacterium]
MLYIKDFRKLLIVCLKMLFRKTTRKRFIFLVAAFLFMMGFNTYSYVMRFHKTEIQKQDVLEEKAFKIFFLRSSTRTDCARFLSQYEKKILDYGSEIIKEAFIYQNNLYVNFYPPPANSSPEGKAALDLLYGLFNIKGVSGDFFLKEGISKYDINVRNNYFDHNGVWLSDEIIESRHDALRQDLIDIADMIRDDVRGKKADIFNSLRNTIFDSIKRASLGEGYEPNPYISRVESIIPMNFLHLLTNISLDNTTDIFDLAESVRHGDDATIETAKSFLNIPAVYSDKLQYGDIDIYPRYIPLYSPDILKPKWNWLFYQDIDIKTDFMDYIDRLHFKGHYMFSYEKSHIIKDKIKKINDDIHSNHIHFYLTDLSIGIAFPFMISLFAFIHLKTEIAFLLMFKNRIRKLLFIFWLLPVFLMLLVKGSILTVYVFCLLFTGFGFSAYIIFSLLITFLIASMAFYPINRWCFSQFTGENLNLYSLHKGR